MNLNTLPIIKSLLDTDVYKLYMQQAVFHHYKKISVVAEFRCRNNEKLGKYTHLIRYQIQQMMYITLTSNEYKYLKSLPFFTKDYIDWLKLFRFNPDQIVIYNTPENQLKLQMTGLWHEVILWEVPILALISEIVHKDRYPNIIIKDALNQLHKVIDIFYNDAKFYNIDLSKFSIIDFGTRRRFSYKIQHAIIKKLKCIFPYFSGTSNCVLAKKFKLQLIGTQAHEWFQAHQQITSNLSESQKVALKIWLDEYPEQLGIALTDCITMDAFLKDFDIQFAYRYQGLRHDSGDPFTWGEKAINHYKKLKIAPMSKTLIFSDNLNFKKSLIIYKHFHKRINLIFGIGTQLTCNIPNIKPLNIVIKLIKCNNKPVAKLSDSVGKTIYNDKEFLIRLKQAFNITNFN